MGKKKKIIIMVTASCISFGILIGVSRGIWVEALFDEEDAVHINAGEIEDGTLIIGTHLIHLNAMGDEIYELAEVSASESNQMKTYYKSELADGSWFDITNAASLKDITTEGTPVENSEVEELFMTHHTRSDGITYDLKTGNAVCMFDISNPYNLENLSELEPLKLQYDILTDKTDKSKTDEFCEEEIREFFGMDVRDAQTDQLDVQIAALQRTYVSAGDDKRSVLAETMEAADAARRRIVLEKLVDPLNALIERLQGKDVEIEDGDDQENHFEVNADLNAGASDSIQNIEESILEYASKELSEGSTTLSKEEYAVKKAMIDAAESGDMAALDAAVEKAGLLKNIMENVTADAGRELEYLNNTILPAAKAVYSGFITGGAGEDYKAAALNSNSSQGVLNETLKARMNEAEAAKSELQFLSGAALGKMNAEEGTTFLDNLSKEADEMKNGIQDDAFAPYANSSVESYTEYLKNLSANRNPTENAGALSKLLEQKGKKQEEKLSALDENDLEGARKADAEIAELDTQIDALEKKMSESGENIGISGGETAQTAIQSAKNLSKAAVETIQDGSTEGVLEAIDGLGALMDINPDAALDGLQDMYKALASAAYLEGAKEDGSGASENQDAAKTLEFESCMVKVEDMIADNASSLNQSALSEKEAKKVLEETAGKKMEEQSEEEQAALLQASLAALEQQANEGIKKMAQTLAAQMEANGSPYIFRQYNDPVKEYIPARTISKCMGYRYVYENSGQKATLSKKSDYLTFRAFQIDYEKGKEKKELSVNAGFQADIYLSEQDTEELFKCTAQYVPGSDLALLVTKENSDQASAYLSMLLTRLGG